MLRGDDAKEDFRRLRHALHAMGAGVPALYKQYIDVVEPGGARFLAFGVDAGFGYCTDGLVVVDVTRLKPEKRARYIGEMAGRDAGRNVAAAEPAVPVSSALGD